MSSGGHSPCVSSSHARPWYMDAVFYEVYIRAFADSNGDGHGDVRGLIGKLDYLRDLGVDCLWLLPCYPSPLRDDGYDVADYCNVLPEYGTIEDINTLLEECSKRDMRVILDFIPNHSSDQHPWFQSSRADPNGEYGDYYVWSDDPDKYAGVRIIFCDTEPSNWTFDEVRKQYFWHRFFSTQPDLNYDNPKVHEEMLNVVRYWLSKGVAGLRCDAVPYLYQREGTSCENLPETHEFIKKLRHVVDTEFQDKLLLSEANMWPRDVRPYFGDGDEFHMAFQFPVMPRIFMSIARGDRSCLVDIINDTPPIPENCQWCIFLRNHDELTLEMVTEEDRQFMWNFYAPEDRMRLNLGIRRRLAPLFDNDRRRIDLAHGILFALPGAPIIYYGDEIGMGDNIYLSDRNGCRTPMQWSGLEPNAGFSTASSDCLYAPVNSGEYGPEIVNVKSALEDPRSIYHFVRRLISVRRQHRAFATSAIAWILDESQPSTISWIRSSGEDMILCVAHLSSSSLVHVTFSRERIESIVGLPLDPDVPCTDLIRDELFSWISTLTDGESDSSSSSSVHRDSITIPLSAYQFRWICLTPR